MNTLAEKSCKPCREPKAPVFKMGDVVQNNLGEVFKINLIRQQDQTIGYAYVTAYWSDNMQLANVRFYSGHELKRFTGKSK